jgi:hypothetical protein
MGSDLEKVTEKATERVTETGKAKVLVKVMPLAWEWQVPFADRFGWDQVLLTFWQAFRCSSLVKHICYFYAGG